MGIISAAANFYATAQQAKRSTNKSILGQLFEIARLRMGPNKLGLSEYYKFGLSDDNRFSWDAKREFVGWRGEHSYGCKLNARPWNVLTGDKLVSTAAFRGLQLPVPRLLAVYHPHGRFVADTEVIDSEAALADFLRNRATYPLFSKPSHGALGRNSVAAVAYDRESDTIVLASEQRIPVMEYVQACYASAEAFPWEAGFLFQERLEPDPRVTEKIGGTVSGLRMICFNTDEKPILLRVVWKLPVGNNMTDNFDHGGSGNLLADLDVETGVVNRVITGTGFDLKQVSHHPDTGHSLDGLHVPDWHKYAELCLAATSAFPGVRLQHWDIAVTDRGPVILELNTFGDFDLPQLAAGQGMATARFRELLSTLENKYSTYRGPGDY